MYQKVVALNSGVSACEAQGSSAHGWRTGGVGGSSQCHRCSHVRGVAPLVTWTPVHSQHHSSSINEITLFDKA